MFELLELGLPVGGGLTFDLLSSAVEPVITGHADGVITLDLAETDPVHREQTRTELDEPYRTVLGHLRHEIGHYYQPILAPEGSDALERCRELMGDEREDYQAALDRHYAERAAGRLGRPLRLGLRDDAPVGGLGRDVRPLPAHPRRAADRGRLRRQRLRARLLAADAAPLYSYPGAAPGDLRAMLDAWLPLTYALNAINRSLGEGDLYPFVLAPAVIEKLDASSTA